MQKAKCWREEAAPEGRSPGLEAKCGVIRKGLREAGQRPTPDQHHGFNQSSDAVTTEFVEESRLGAAGPQEAQPSWRRSISTPLPLRKPAWACLEQSQINNTS